MYMRLVQAVMKPGALPQVKELYEKEIIPMLQSTEGCLHISLLQSDSHPEECVSLTLWRQKRHADAYESGGLFQKFVADVAPYSGGAAEFTLHLGPDLKLQYDPVAEPPVIKAFDLPIHSASAILPRDSKKSIFLRIVTPQIREGMEEDFKNIYTTQILPHLRSAPGCLHAHLVENVKQTNQLISLTIWHNRQDAENYERSGLFSELTKKVEPCFTEIYQLKQQLGKQTASHTITSEELSVEGYKVVVGRNFM
jgi:quinol monooxygenase YgiN